MAPTVYLVCADIVEKKINVEIPFAAPPTLAEMKQRADQVFYEEAQALSRQGRLSAAASELLATTVTAPGFDARGQYKDSGLLSLGRCQIYDDSLLRWVDLVSPSQLHEYDQVYIFPKHRAHLSQVRDLPPPQPTGAALARSEVGDAHYAAGATQRAANVSSASPPRGREGSHSMATSMIVPHRSGAGGGLEGSPSRMTRSGNEYGAHARAVGAHDATREVLSIEELDRRQRQIFNIADRNNNSYVSVDDFRALFQRTKVLFNDVTITELFAMHAQSGRFMTFAEWQLLARHFPQLFAAVYRRLTETQSETDMSNELELGAKRLLGLRDEADELQRRLDMVRQDVAAQEVRSKEIAERLAQQRTSRVPVEEEEQVVLEKEVRIHFQREMLSREERELNEASKRLDERAAAVMHPGESRRY